MPFRKLGLAAIGLSSALALGGAARAATIVYDFFGTGSGSLNGAAFNGDFSVVETGDTTTVDTSNPILLNNHTSSAVFTAGALTAGLTGTFDDVILNKDPAFPTVGFGQAQPAPVFFVAEATTNAAFAAYDLASAFPLTSGTPSFLTQTFLTNAGDLTFTSISALSFEASTGAVPEPETWSLMILGLGMLGAGSRAFRRHRTVATA